MIGFEPIPRPAGTAMLPITPHSNMLSREGLEPTTPGLQPGASPFKLTNQKYFLLNFEKVCSQIILFLTLEF